MRRCKPKHCLVTIYKGPRTSTALSLCLWVAITDHSVPLENIRIFTERRKFYMFYPGICPSCAELCSQKCPINLLRLTVIAHSNYSILICIRT